MINEKHLCLNRSVSSTASLMTAPNIMTKDPILITTNMLVKKKKKKKKKDLKVLYKE